LDAGSDMPQNPKFSCGSLPTSKPALTGFSLEIKKARCQKNTEHCCENHQISIIESWTADCASQ